MDIIKTKKRGSLIVISGPTCAGKGTICKELLKINKNIIASLNNPKMEDIIRITMILDNVK